MMNAAPREAALSAGYGMPSGFEQLPRGDMYYELLPERDPIYRRLGFAALKGAGVPSTRWRAEDLPSFEAYIVAKYPYLPSDAVAELVRRFNELRTAHAETEAIARVGGQR
jgi:hypothetical protein